MNEQNDVTPAASEPQPPQPPSGLKRKWAEFWSVLPAAPVPSPVARWNAKNDLDVALDVESPTVARFVLAETKDQVERKRTAHRTIEGKATSIIGFATAVLGFVTASNSSGLVKWTWWEWILALLFEFAAIVAGVMALRPMPYLLPDSALFNSPAVLEVSKNEARIAMALSERWAEIERSLDTANDTRSRRLWVAIWSFVIGVLIILIVTVASIVIGTHPWDSRSAAKGQSRWTGVSKGVPVRGAFGKAQQQMSRTGCIQVSQDILSRQSQERQNE
jgi:protein-S-isoprenylcysteine O-methyltransferase Ste14